MALAEAIANTRDGLGPYLPVLCETENTGELIPGKISAVPDNAIATYCAGDQELYATRWRVVRGYLLPED